MNVFLLLDRSGSMRTMWDETIGSINGYVSKLNKTDKVHLAVFDSVSHDVIRDVKVKNWVDVTNQEVFPRGGTPLYDSCGKIMTVAEEAKSKKTVLVVLTDGYENSSKEYTQDSIKAKVKSFETRGWEVVFLGANFDSVESVSGSVGVASGKTMNISAGNMMRGLETLSVYTNLYSATGVAMNFTNEDKIKATIKVDIK